MVGCVLSPTCGVCIILHIGVRNCPPHQKVGVCIVPLVKKLTCRDGKEKCLPESYFKVFIFVFLHF